MQILRFFSAASVAFLVSAMLYIISMLSFLSYQGVNVDLCSNGHHVFISGR